MALIHNERSYCAKFQLDLFIVPPPQLCIDRNVTVEYRPTKPLAGNGSIEFEVDGSDDFTHGFTNLSQTYLFLKV